MSNGSDGNGSRKGKELAATLALKAPQSGYHNLYPAPLAAYKEVVENPALFRNTLEKLHTQLGTKFMVPTIGGTKLDLHRLFAEVTSRGGIEKVIGDRRWREVTTVFSFPSTATNASFVLRKYYMSLLHHYEQLYFFRSQGWNSPSIASSNAPSTTSVPEETTEPSAQHSSNPLGKRRTNGDFLPSGSPPPANKSVVGVIDGKFEHGYFVTVMVGTQKLRGVLYHTLEQTAASTVAPSGLADGAKVSGRRRRRRKLSKRDPSHPKPNRSGYNFFFAEQHARLRQIHSGKDREISKIIGDLWNKLTDTEKAVYQEQGVKDKERYRSELAVYRETQQMGQVIRNAVPIQQRPADPTVATDGTDTKLPIDEGEHNSSEDGSDSEEGIKSDDDSDPDIGGTGTGSTSLVAEQPEPSNEGEDFELRRRDTPAEGTEAELRTSSEDAESKKQ